MSLGSYIKGQIKGYIWNQIKVRQYVIVRQKTAESLIQHLTGRKIKIKEYANHSILHDYRLELIKPGDTVLDIGAGGGLYSLIAATFAKKVYAIEPVFSPPEYLKNKPMNVEILPFVMGKDNVTVKCQFWGKTVYKKARDLNYILNEIDSNITVIKSDCEGCEWDGFLGCKDFKKVRIIDMEYHTKNKQNLNDMIRLLHKNGFSVIKRGEIPIGMLYVQKERENE